VHFFLPFVRHEAASRAAEASWCTRSTAAQLSPWLLGNVPTVVSGEELPMDWVAPPAAPAEDGGSDPEVGARVRSLCRGPGSLYIH
jgi:hypothetical protein